MILFIIIILLGLLILLRINGTVRNRIAKTIINLHTFWWSLLIIISILNPADLKPVSISAYCLIELYILGINFGFILIDNRYKNDANKIINTSVRYDINNIINNKAWTSIILIEIGVCSYLLYKFIGLLAFNTFQQAHSMRMGTEFFESPILMILYNNIAMPICYFLMFVTAVLILTKRLNYYLILSIIAIMETFLIGFGKNLILIMLFQFTVLVIVAINFNLKKLIGYVPNKRKIIRNFIWIAISLVLLTIAFSSLRKFDTSIATNNSGEILQEFYREVMTYLVGPFRMLDYAIAHDDFLNSLGIYTFGKSTLLGFDKIIYWILSIFNIEYESGYEIILGGMQSANIVVTNTSYLGEGMNYAFSSILFFYLDFGILGVFLIPFVIGAILRIIIHKLLISPNIFYLALLVFFVSELLISFFNWELAKPGLFLYCLLLWTGGHLIYRSHGTNKKYIVI